MVVFIVHTWLKVFTKREVASRSWVCFEDIGAVMVRYVTTSDRPLENGFVLKRNYNEGKRSKIQM